MGLKNVLLFKQGKARSFPSLTPGAGLSRPRLLSHGPGGALGGSSSEPIQF